MINKHLAATELIKESIEILKATWLIYPDFGADRDCSLWLKQEHDYISSLQSEPKVEQMKIEYLKAIERLECAE